MIAKFINCISSRFNLLPDTQEPIVNDLKKNNSIYENMKKSTSTKQLFGRNNFIEN